MAGHTSGRNRHDVIRLGRYGWVPWVDVLSTVRRRTGVPVASDFLANLLVQDMYRPGSKQRLEFLMAVHDVELRQRWERLLAMDRSGVEVIDPRLSPFPSTAQIGFGNLSAIYAVRANHGHSELPGLTLDDTQFEIPVQALDDFPYLLHVTQPSCLLGILRNGLQGMGRLGPMASMYPTWDPRSQLGQRFNAGLGYEIMLVVDAPAVAIDVGI